jgi:hypothetical protein
MVLDAKLQEPVPKSSSLTVSDAHTELMDEYQNSDFGLRVYSVQQKAETWFFTDLLQELSGLTQT